MGETAAALEVAYATHAIAEPKPKPLEANMLAP